MKGQGRQYKDVAKNKKNYKWEFATYEVREKLMEVHEILSRPQAEIEYRIANGDIKNESGYVYAFLSHIKSSRGKNLLWLFEMFLGKAKQQEVEQQLQEIKVMISDIEKDL